MPADTQTETAAVGRELPYTEEQITLLEKHYPEAAAFIRSRQTAGPKPRRWIVEFAGDVDVEPGKRFLYTVKSAREVKPITLGQIVNAVVKAKQEYRPTADIDYVLFLRGLGIEVEDAKPDGGQ